MKRIVAQFFAVLAMAVLTPIAADAQSTPEGLIVVYGKLSPTREGDVDRSEQILFSVPADTPGRIYVRLFDPETFGKEDFSYGGTADAATTFIVVGGEGAFSGADRPEMVADNARAPRTRHVFPASRPGKQLLEKFYENDRVTDGRWVTLGAVRAAQGEQIGGRAYFRLDVEGTRGNDGNGFSIDVSRARDRARAPDGLEMFSYQPTIRWTADGTATRVRFTGSVGPYTVQNFDAANGELSIVTDYADLPLAVSGQDFWSVDTFDTDETNLALSLSKGFESPNDVTVAIFDGSGGALALKMPPSRALDPARPTAIGTGRPLANCESVAFDASNSLGRTPLSYEWDFGDGQASDQPVIAHLYNEPGRYLARLRVLEDGGRPGAGADMTIPVHVRPAPIAKPGDAIVVAPGQVIPFDGTASKPSDSPITRYVWSFGEGQNVEGPLAEKAYEAPGAYRVVLRVSDDSAHPCNFGVATRDVKVNFPPVAEAGTSQTAKAEEMLAFDGSASYDVDGGISKYEWDMGDGTTQSGALVSHAYAVPGRYTVALKVTDDSEVANAHSEDTLTVDINAPPEPVIAIPDRPVSVSEAAQLDGSQTTDLDGTILSYLWEFGDGAFGEGETVNYAWTAPGIYTVTLTVTDDSGTASATQMTQRKFVVDAAPIANAGPDQYVTVSDVQFDGTRSQDIDGTISTYEWQFGDGGTATGPRPVHAYARPGVYEVALVVRDASGAPLNITRDTMIVTVNASPIADAGPDQTVAPSEEFVLSARASVDPDGTIEQYIWQLPDGSSKTNERISTSIDDPGTYRIGLSVLDNFVGGPARDHSEVAITVNASPIAEAGADLLIAPGEPTALDASQSFDPDGNIVSYLWEFDDDYPTQSTARVVRSYKVPGVWSAQLIVTDDAGVANSTGNGDVTISVNSAPVAAAGEDIETDIFHVVFDASDSSDADGDALIYRWDFGDGSPPAYGQKIAHIYPRSGKFPVTLQVDDGNGLSNSKAIDAMVVFVNARPMADAGGNRDVCSGESILFDASDSLDPDGGLLLYNWDFGDGTQSDLVNPTKIYENPGAYPVTLKVRNGKGTEWGSDTDRIAALVREGPIANAGPDMSVCTNQAVRFDGSKSSDADGAVNAFQWTMGDGGTASGEMPEYRFRKPGNYPVTLTITGDAVGACSPLDTDVVNVEVVAAPDQKIVGADRAGAGLPTDFKVTLEGLDGATVVSHAWSFSDGGMGEGSEVSHTFAEPGAYFATVTTELSGGNAGCSTIETRRKVLVNSAPTAKIASPENIATGAAVVFDGSVSFDTDGALIGFMWDFGDGTKTTGVAAAHAYTKPGKYAVSLTVTDDAGVGNSANTVVRNILVNPAPFAGLDLAGQMCPGVAVPWSVSVSETTRVRWAFGDGATAEGPQVSHGFEAAGLYPVTISMDDEQGLLNSQRSEEIYARVNSAPTALAGPDRVVCANDIIVFDASASGDIDGEITRWVWEFSDGVTLEGPQVQRSFQASGPVDVELTVIDDSGAECNAGTDIARVLVNSTPHVNAGPDLSVPIGAAHDVVRFDANSTSDADGQGVSITWDYGDGVIGSGALSSHRYGAPGSYIVTVTAKDTTGLVCGIARDTAVVTAQAREQ